VALAAVALVEGLKEIELVALLLLRGVVVFDVLDQLLDFRVLSVDVGALKNAGEEGGLPVLGFLDGVASRNS
jgi:hypothetical protein